MSFDRWPGLEHPLSGNCARKHNEQASIPNNRFLNNLNLLEALKLLEIFKVLEILKFSGTLRLRRRPKLAARLVRPDAVVGIQPLNQSRDLRRVTSLRRTLSLVPFAAADREAFLSLGRKHVVVHADYHRDEDDR